MPTSLLRGGDERIAAALVAPKVAQPKLHRIDTQVRRDLVHERLAGKAAGHVAGRAQITGSQRSLVRLHPWDKRRCALLVFESIDLAAALGTVGITVGGGFHTDLTRSEQAQSPARSSGQRETSI